jgi:hypothetical protein
VAKETKAKGIAFEINDTNFVEIDHERIVLSLAKPQKRRTKR